MNAIMNRTYFIKEGLLSCNLDPRKDEYFENYDSIAQDGRAFGKIYDFELDR